jgi:diacylglycerol kinase (ATP)
MRITLMHNPKAGRGGHDKDELMALLTKAGHRTIYQSTKMSGYKNALQNATDLVLVAGGDGTTAKVAARLIDSGIPLAILPLGTANNLARSLGFAASPKQIIAGLASGKKRSFDVGLARGPWGKRYFFEAAGAGLLADYVQAAKEKKNKAEKKKKKISKEEELREHILELRKMLQNHPTQPWKIEIDGNNISDRYIIWEAMNIRSVGPALYLAPQAAIKDGRFDFAAVLEGDRSFLMKYFKARLAGKRTRFPMPMCRFRKLKILWEKSPIHFDDDIWPGKKKPKRPSNIEITVKPSALVILQPAASWRPKQKRAFLPHLTREVGQKRRDVQ